MWSGASHFPTDLSRNRESEVGESRDCISITWVEEEQGLKRGERGSGRSSALRACRPLHFTVSRCLEQFLGSCLSGSLTSGT